MSTSQQHQRPHRLSPRHHKQHQQQEDARPPPIDYSLLPQPTFYPQDHRPTPFSSSSTAAVSSGSPQQYIGIPALPLTYLTPDQDPSGSRGVPIFHPTMAEFEDFEAYATRLEPWGLHYGVVKVVPPREWKEGLPAITPDQLRRVKIKKPIEQNMFGRAGLFRATNVEKSKTFSFRAWVEHCLKPGMKAPSPEEIMAMSKRTDRQSQPQPPRSSSGTGQSRAAKRRKVDGGSKPAAVVEPPLLPATTAALQSADAVQEVEVPPPPSPLPSPLPTQAQAQPPISPRRMLPLRSARSASSSSLAASPSGRTKSEGIFASQQQGAAVGPSSPTTTTNKSITGNAAAPPPPSMSAAAATAGRRKRPTLPSADDDPWYDTFDVSTGCYPPGVTTSADAYTPEVCRELTRKVWRERGMGDPPWYGADLEGTLFDPSVKSWNTEGLPSLLTRLNLKRSLPGVNTSYLYFGSYRATFAWHVEDCYLGSINYIHFGAPKLWQSIPAAKAQAFERFMASAFDKDSQTCRNFLAHKSCLASPTNLAKDGIQGNAVVQHAGEFILTYPGGYHSGFNAGINAASSCNFALDSWPEYGRKWKPCMCRDDTVRIDVDAILQESADRDREQKEKTEGTKKRRRRKTEQEQEDDASKPTTPVAATPKVRRLSFKFRGSENGSHVNEDVKSEIDVERESSRALKASGRPCILCTNLSSDDIVPLHEPSAALVKLAGKSVPTAHELCVRAVPETWLNDDDQVMGCEDIPKSRWSLPCVICRDKKGAKVQCSASSCVRSFHVTCAHQDERTQFNEREEKQWILNGEWKEGDPAKQRFIREPAPAYEILCWQHSPVS